MTINRLITLKTKEPLNRHYSTQQQTPYPPLKTPPWKKFYENLNNNSYIMKQKAH